MDNVWVLPAAEFDALLAALDESPREMPRLRELLATQPVWENVD
jgi:uncharacterized protein (DUF1778 family)